MADPTGGGARRVGPDGLALRELSNRRRPRKAPSRLEVPAPPSPARGPERQLVGGALSPPRLPPGDPTPQTPPPIGSPARVPPPAPRTRKPPSGTGPTPQTERRRESSRGATGPHGGRMGRGTSRTRVPPSPSQDAASRPPPPRRPRARPGRAPTHTHPRARAGGRAGRARTRASPLPRPSSYPSFRLAL